MLSSPLLSVPTKKPSEVDYCKPLKKFIGETFGKDLEKDIGASIDEFNGLRTRLCTKYGERSDAILDVHNRYYDQLTALEAKAAICVGGPISIHFKWQRAFERDSARRNLSVQSSAYEKVCVLFNIGALQSQLAEAQNRASDDGLKQCMRYLQLASGTFLYLRDQMASPFVTSQLGSSELPVDLSSDALGALSALVIAQAQDCMVVKARNDRMKDALMIKLVMQCRDMYNDFLKLASPYREALPREWFPIAEGKRILFEALGDYYAARGHIDAQEHGKAISRLTNAQKVLGTMASSDGKRFAYGDELNAIKSLLETSQKDNNIIYHDKIADYRSLPTLERAQVAKPIPPKLPLTTNFRDIFEKLVPMRVHVAMQAFETKLKDAAGFEVRRLRDATGLLNQVLMSFNLPAALEEVLNSAAEQTGRAQRASEVDLPDSIKENSRKVRDAGGIVALRQLFSTIPELLSQNRSMLDEIGLAIDEEETADRKLRDQFGNKWSRTQSEKLNASFRAELAKYRSLVDTAASADGIVRDRYSKLDDVIALLSQSEDSIREAMPKRSSESALSGNQLSALASSQSVAQLKELCDRARSLKTAREDLENDLTTLCNAKDAANDKDADRSNVQDVFTSVRTAFLGALQSDGATITREEELSNERIADTLRGYRELTQASLNEQEAVLRELQDANNAFLQERARVTGQKAPASGAQDTVNMRAAFLQSLHSGYDGYVELRTNVEEGNKFYADLLQILMKFQQRVQDYCFGRKIEKDEALADLNASAASSARSQPPENPAYQKAAAPSRPPPPVPVAPTPTPASAPPPPPTSAACPPPSSGVPVMPQAPPAQAGVPQPQVPYQLPYPAPMPANWPPQAAPAQPYGAAYPGAPPGYPPYSAYSAYPPAPAYPYPAQPQPGYPYAYGYPPPPTGYPGYPPQGPPNPPR